MRYLNKRQKIHFVCFGCESSLCKNNAFLLQLSTSNKFPVTLEIKGDGNHLTPMIFSWIVYTLQSRARD